MQLKLCPRIEKLGFDQGHVMRIKAAQKANALRRKAGCHGKVVDLIDQLYF